MTTRQKEFKMNFELLQPWSTFVMKMQLPQPIFDKMLKITDEIVDNVENERSHGEYLAGSIKDEIWVDHEILQRENVYDFFLNVVRSYVIEALCQKMPFVKHKVLNEEWYTQLGPVWIISQKDNEYNPIHFHTDCHLSTVMYLKIPEYLPSRKSYKNEDGAITFISNSTRNPIWGAPVMTLLPKVGDFFIFPSTQAHCVYPFRTADGKGERRSVAFNASFSSKSINDKNEYLPKTQKSNR